MTSGVQIQFAQPSDDRALTELDAASWPVAVQVAPPQTADKPFFTDWRQPADVIVATNHDSRRRGDR